MDKLNVHLLQEIRNKVTGNASDSVHGNLDEKVYLQQIRDSCRGAAPSKYEDLDDVIYLQQIRDAILGIDTDQKVYGNLDQTVYLKQILFAFQGTNYDRVGDLDTDSYLRAILDVAYETPYWKKVKSYFGSRIIGLWPLTQDATDKSGNGLHGTPAFVTFDSVLGALFNGASSKINIFSSALASKFNKDELAISCFITPTLASWTDGNTHRFFIFQTDGNNFTNGWKSTNNKFSLNYNGNGTIDGVDYTSQSFVTPTHIALSASKTYDQFRAYKEGIESLSGTQYDLGTWAGSLVTAVIGALSLVPAHVFSGYIRNFVLFNGPITESEAMMLASPTFTDPQVPVYVSPLSNSRRFVWISDVHRGAIYNYNLDTWSGIIRHIDAIEPEFVVDTGDHVATPLDDPNFYLEYNRGVALSKIASWYHVPGNHDAAVSGGYYNDFTNYLAAGFPQHFTVDIGNFRFIGFTSYQDNVPVATQAWIEAGEKTWLLGELGSLGGKTPILMTHFQGDFLAAGGWATFWADIGAYGVKAVLSGHDHFPCLSAVKAGGIIQVMGPSVWGQNAGEFPGMCVIHVFDSYFSIEFQNARYPYLDNSPTTTPAYTTITIYR